jgi:hypothetical protein
VASAPSLTKRATDGTPSALRRKSM